MGVFKGSKMNFMGLTHAQSEEMEARRGSVRLANGGGAKLQTTAAKTTSVISSLVKGKVLVKTAQTCIINIETGARTCTP